MRLFKDAFGWGFALWAIGYVLSIALFSFVPISAIGWVITPVATALTIWVAWKYLHGANMVDFVAIGFVWLAVAVVGDYIFIVKAFHPADGYYKPDVYLYYLLTVAIPVVVGWRKVGSTFGQRRVA